MVGIPSLRPRKRSLSLSRTPLTPRGAKVSSGLDFQDASDLPYSPTGAPARFQVPLTPPPSQLDLVARQSDENRGGSAGGFSSLSFGSEKRRNEGEQGRLQGLMRSDTVACRRSRVGREEERMGRWEKMKVWMVNEGTYMLSLTVYSP